MYVRRGIPVGESGPISSSYPYDPRALRKTDVFALVQQVTSLSELQRKDLYAVLVKYLDHLIIKPGKCNLLEYKFNVSTDQPIVRYSRPIPFAIRPAVRAHINQMLKHGIMEISASPILNPLTVVRKESGEIRICIDARKANEFAVPDRERAPPLQELLQRFNGARYFGRTNLEIVVFYGDQRQCKISQVNFKCQIRDLTVLVRRSTQLSFDCQTLKVELEEPSILPTSNRTYLEEMRK
jgi:hypothetical protein